MRFILNQLFIYAILIVALLMSVVLIANTPDAVLQMTADVRGWFAGVAFCWGVIGICIGVDTFRFLNDKQID